MKCVWFLLKSDQLRIRQLSFGFLLSKCNHKDLLKCTRGQNNRFQNCTTFDVFLLCDRTFLFNFKDMLSNCCLKFK